MFQLHNEVSLGQIKPAIADEIFLLAAMRLKLPCSRYRDG